jgi:cytochrome c oxidase subunit IV
MTQPAVEHAPREEDELAHHPQPRQYVVVGVWLAIVTALEVGIYYIDSMRDIIVPFLLVFAFIKFFLVATWFMHLKFDSHLFRRLFVSGLVLALIIFAIVMTIFFARGGAVPEIAGG